MIWSSLPFGSDLWACGHCWSPIAPPWTFEIPFPCLGSALLESLCLITVDSCLSSLLQLTWLGSSKIATYCNESNSIDSLQRSIFYPFFVPNLAWPYLLKVKWRFDCILFFISPSYMKLLIFTIYLEYMYNWAYGVFEKHPSSSLSNILALWSQPHLTGSYKKQQENSSICFSSSAPNAHPWNPSQHVCILPCPGRAHGAQRWVFLSPCPSEGGPAASPGYSPTLDLVRPNPILPTWSSTRPFLTSLVKAARCQKAELNHPSKAHLWAVGSNWVIAIRSSAKAGEMSTG